MRYGSLFTGIGGIDLGLDRAGMECRWQVECNEFCRSVLERHWPGVPRHGDVRAFRDIERVDVVCGGFPCQPVSLAGRMKVDEDERWLWPEFFRVVRDVRPRYVVVENVRGLLSGGIEEVVTDLASVGHCVEWAVLPAAAFGAPHLRERVFVVSYPEPVGWQAGCGVAEDQGGAGQRWSEPPPGDQRVFGYAPGGEHQWEAEPGVRRVADGVPDQAHRLGALGNAVVPQVAEWVGRQILRHAAYWGV